MATTSSARKNRRLSEAHGKLCPYCTRTMDRGNRNLSPTEDHIKARSKIIRKPGENSNLNKGRIIIVCSECNLLKAALTLEEFIYALIDKNKKLLSVVDNNLNRMRNIRYFLDIGLEKE